MLTSMPPTRAIVRQPSRRFEQALVHGIPEPVDLSLVAAQHAAIVQALERCGLSVSQVSPLDEAPDGCFVEDRAVVLGDRALITRSAVASRGAEAASVAEALAAHLDISTMEDGTLDGGDVLRVGQELWVGQSARTNAAGTQELARFAADFGMTVRSIDVRGLHLKCVCSCPAPDLLLYAEGYGLEEHLPSSVRAVAVPEHEAYAANAVGALGRVVVAAGFPITAELLTDAGLTVEAVDNSEFKKRDGSLTCLSVLF